MPSSESEPIASVLFNCRLPAPLYARLRNIGLNDSYFYGRGMTGVVVEALMRYLPEREQRELSFTEIYIRERPPGVPPLPPPLIEKARAYGARYNMDDARPRFLSRYLEDHYWNDTWNKHTWAMVLRELRVRAAKGTPLPRSDLLPPQATEADLPQEAHEEDL